MLRCWAGIRLIRVQKLEKVIRRTDKDIRCLAEVPANVICRLFGLVQKTLAKLLVGVVANTDFHGIPLSLEGGIQFFARRIMMDGWKGLCKSQKGLDILLKLGGPSRVLVGQLLRLVEKDWVGRPRWSIKE